MTRNGTLAFVLGVALVAAVIAGIHLEVSWGEAVIGFFILMIVSGLTLDIIFATPSAGYVFLDVVIAGFYAYFAITRIATRGTLLGVALGALYGAVVYLGWMRAPASARGPHVG